MPTTFPASGGPAGPPRLATRFVRVASAAALIAALALSACGDDDTGGGAAATAGFPVKIEHKFGSTEIPAEPKRIVAVGYNDSDFALALGKIPVGTRGPTDYPYAKRPWAQDALDGADPTVIGSTELNFEKIAASRPDLILGVYSGMTEGDYGKLSKIAPTVAQTDEYLDFAMPWQEQLRLTGRALGREDRAKQLVAQVEDDFSAARRQHAEFKGATAVLASPTAGGGFSVFTGDDLRMRFFTSLGLEVPAAIDKLAGDKFYTELGSEKVGLLDQDVVIVFGTREVVEKNRIFRRLDAVREGRVIYLPTGTPDLYGALNYNSPLSLPFQIDGFAPRLAAALDGKPGTAVAPIR